MQWRQVAIANELFHADLIADVIQHVLWCADRPVLESKRCRREPNHAHRWIDRARRLEKGEVHALAVGWDEVGFINENEIEATEVVGATIDRLDTGDDHRVINVATFESSRVDANEQGIEKATGLRGILIHEFLHVGQDQDASIPTIHDIGTELPDQDTLATTGRDHHAGVIITLTQVRIHRINRGLLVRAKRDHACLRRPYSAISAASTSPSCGLRLRSVARQFTCGHKRAATRYSLPVGCPSNIDRCHSCGRTSSYGNASPAQMPRSCPQPVPKVNIDRTPCFGIAWTASMNTIASCRA